MRWLRSQRGDTLVEVVLAIAILGSVLTIAFRMSSESFQLGLDSRQHIQGINVAQTQAEELRSYASQLIAAGTPLTEGAVCAIGSTCSMQLAGGVASPTAGPFDCSAMVTAGCTAQIQSVDDIAIGPKGIAPYPEIDEKVTVTWPTSVSSTEACNAGATANCETATLDVRLADTTNFQTIDCSVAGSPGCSNPTPVVPPPPPPPQEPHINTANGTSCPANCSITATPGSTINFNVTNISGGSIEIVVNSGDPSLGTAPSAGGVANVSATYPASGGSWTVQACLVSDPTTCSDNKVTVTAPPPVPRTALYEKYDLNGGTHDGYCISTNNTPFGIDLACGGFGFSFFWPVGQLGWLASSTDPGLATLYSAYNNTNGHRYFTTDPTPANLPLGYSLTLFSTIGKIEPLVGGGGPGSCASSATEPLYRWYDANDDYYYLSLTNSGLTNGWVSQGAIGCVYNSAT